LKFVAVFVLKETIYENGFKTANNGSISCQMTPKAMAVGGIRARIADASAKVMRSVVLSTSHCLLA